SCSLGNRDSQSQRNRCRVCNMGTYSPEELISENFVLFVTAAMRSDAEPRIRILLWNLLLRPDLPRDLVRLRIRGILLACKKN
ncbi:hypothetical protein EDC04DRAFT_2720436, partial [Pisolithus marmoratus]